MEKRSPASIQSEALECVQLAAAFLRASLLAGTSNTSAIRSSFSNSLPRAQVPASKLAGAKAAASCTHSKASLFTP
jgi:hypothetical protein